jgi:glycosyltransferase involved in cell wall biosynthesis
VIRRVLVVAHGFPSHDMPGRGSFVADHVAALRAAGTEVDVASFETVQVGGGSAERARRLAVAEAAWARAVSDPSALTPSRDRDTAGIAVARLPVVRTWGQMDGSEAVEQAARHAAVLAPFGRAHAARAVRAGRPLELIHAHTGLPDGLAALSLASELGLPLVVTEYDSTLPGRLSNEGAAAAYQRLAASARVVAVSRALADRIGAALAGSGVPVPALAVLPNLVPLDRFPAPSGEPRDDDELLWVGALAEHKGIETLLRAAAIARARRPALHLRMIGGATAAESARWAALARELSVGDAVAVEPAAEREAVARAMRHAGLFVHASPWETFGMVAAEALASGLPIAATPSGGVPEIVGSDGSAGEIAAAPGPEALAEAIVALRDRIDAIDRAGLRRDVVARFGPDAVMTATAAVYEAARPVSATAPTAAVGPGPDASGLGVEPGSAMVVATRPSSAARVAALPVRTAFPVLVVGAPTPAAAPGLAARALGRIARSLPGAGPGPAPDRTTDLHASIRSTWSDVRAAAGAGRPVIVAADADDVAVVLDALGAAAVGDLAPGSLRWLADRQDASADAVGR